eukprot:8372915-Pyramimonas_sp.AAC.1
MTWFLPAVQLLRYLTFQQENLGREVWGVVLKARIASSRTGCHTSHPTWGASKVYGVAAPIGSLAPGCCGGIFLPVRR